MQILFKKVTLRSPRLLKCLRRVGQNAYIALVGDSGVIQRCCEKERLRDGRWDFIFRNANSFTLFCSLLFITIHLLYRANSLLIKTLIMIWLLPWLLLCVIAFYCYRQCMMLTVFNVSFSQLADLRIKYVDLEQSENLESHRTNGFRNTESLVVRRGAPFKVSVQLEGRPFNPKINTLRVKIMLGTFLSILHGCFCIQVV